MKASGREQVEGGDLQVIEEFMSLADGQAVLKTPQALDPEAGVQISMAEAALRSKAISSGLEIDPPTSNPEPTGSRPARVRLSILLTSSWDEKNAFHPADNKKASFASISARQIYVIKLI